ncbi:uncharacterized protein LOC115885207 [Sitophilus oryzae]|uniref:Uncharacterized protein LOC115885207 n=1 Tax=Sitophilus oryzae TaxID=7048 RepID=A0A6J2Y9I5_SITOR|nr:uncharacterized protein LOC115885207 [Sitophilus oryzae]
MAALLKCMAVIVLLIFLVNIEKIAARPGNEWPNYPNPCNKDDIQIEICQRCAKATKSPLVYPMCCNDEDNVYSWCNKYIFFGSNP